MIPCENLPTVNENDGFCPLFTPANRAEAVIEAASDGVRFESVLIDPTAIVSSDVRIGGGSFVNAGCVLGAASSIGRHVVVNRASSIGHHAAIEDFVSIGPGVTIAGQVSIGHAAIIGAGAVLAPGVRIGAFAEICAGAVVTRDVAACTKVAGNPARLVTSGLAAFALEAVIA